MPYTHFNEKDDPKIKGVDDKTMRLVDSSREFSGIPWIITSGRRSAAENKRQPDSVKDSAHLPDPVTGLSRAVDVLCVDSHSLWCMTYGLMQNKAPRIGISMKPSAVNPNILIPTHLHIDTDKRKTQEIIFLELEK